MRGFPCYGLKGRKKQQELGGVTQSGISGFNLVVGSFAVLSRDPANDPEVGEGSVADQKRLEQALSNLAILVTRACQF